MEFQTGVIYLEARGDLTEGYLRYRFERLIFGILRYIDCSQSPIFLFYFYFLFYYFATHNELQAE